MNFGGYLEAILREPFISHGSIKSLDVYALLRLSGLNIFHPDSFLVRPLNECLADVFWANVTVRDFIGSARHSNDLSKAPDTC